MDSEVGPSLWRGMALYFKTPAEDKAGIEHRKKIDSCCKCLQYDEERDSFIL